jgi:hypothetical protein
MKEYLINLLTEKGIIQDIEEVIPVFEDNQFFGFTHEMMIDFICSQDKATQETIRKNFVKIDFQNGDVAHFYDYLKDGYLEMLKDKYHDFVGDSKADIVDDYIDYSMDNREDYIYQ